MADGLRVLILPSPTQTFELQVQTYSRRLILADGIFEKRPKRNAPQVAVTQPLEAVTLETAESEKALVLCKP